jgi:hypothetical protein
MKTVQSLLCILSLMTAATPLLGESKLPVEEGLVVAYFANDLKSRVTVGAAVTEWPDSTGTVGPMTTESNRPPILMDQGFVGSKTLAVAFEAAEPIQDNDKLAWYRNLPFMNFPVMQGDGDTWDELTVVIAGSGLEQSGVFDTNPGLNPNLRHYGWLSFGDSKTKGSIQNPIPADYFSMPIVQSFVLSRDGFRHATLTSYVNGEETGTSKQTSISPEDQNTMEPFEGLVLRPARPMGDGGPAMGASIGAIEPEFGRKGDFAIAAIAIYSRALSPQEIKKVSEYLIESLSLE